MSHNNIGLLLSETGDAASQRAAHSKALAIRQKLADANPSVALLQRELAMSHHHGALLFETGDTAERGRRTTGHWRSVRS